MRRTIGTLLLAAGMVLAAGPAGAQEPAATMRFGGWLVGAGPGFTRLSGEVTFDGRTYPVTVITTSALALGASYLCGEAQVFGLQQVEDLNGRYVGTTFGATIVGGGHGARWDGAHGISIDAQFHTWGADLTLAADAVRIITHVRDGEPMPRWYWPGPFTY